MSTQNGYEADLEEEAEEDEEEHVCVDPATCPLHCSREECKMFCALPFTTADDGIDRDVYWDAHEKYEETRTPTDFKEAKEETEVGAALIKAYNELIDAKSALKAAKQRENYDADELDDSYAEEEEEYNCPNGE
uniref:Uncharacterized protein n=1 Tax=Kwoniella dejecticola CBS 10117 TaxID=1296121 RepID=A0A1A6AAT1_9TREE|nr:uncharacterized protein I303_03201 [Kwoniella dejecticola CBS 10117]OBR87177.1 hypothetical protein I303_03201 [Kwoniella dejecticola CBS 10117]